MLNKTAKLFVNGGSQAVRLPAEFRFEESEEVFIRRDQVTGEVILSPKPARNTWAEFFALREASSLSADFMTERALNEPLSIRDPFEDE